MKKVSLFYVISFLFFVLGQITWSVSMLFESPIFGNSYIEEWFVGSLFTLCATFGMIGSYKWYKISK